MPLLSVIIPVYNEASTLKEILARISSVKVDKEIIVVDDGSEDGTVDLLRGVTGENIKIIYCPQNRGKGAAFLTGIEAARGEFVIPQDADLEYDPQDYAVLINYALKNNLSVVYGSRFLKGWRGATSFWHYAVNWLLTSFTNLLFGCSLTDMETCYKLVRLDLIKKLHLRSKRFEIEPEITVKLIKQGWPIAELPISYKSRFYHQGKKIGWLDGISSLYCLIKLRLSKN
jgi:glycosyltransferase involved in cell wall biosynthesis